MELVALGIALIVILIAAELFTNGIEWFGHKLNLAEGAVGSVLAAVGTALPETMIPLIAILFAGRADDPSHGARDRRRRDPRRAVHALDAGHVRDRRRASSTGRSVGAPGAQMPVDTHVLGLDIRYFFVAYGIAVGAAFIPAEFSWARYGAVSP